MRAVYALVFVLAVACTPQDDDPDDILDREQFKELLLQAQLIEARVNHELIVEHISQVPTQQYYNELFDREGVSEEQFTATFKYYTARPEELKVIYEEIITELTFRKDQPVGQEPLP